MGGGTEHPNPAGDPCPVLPLFFTPNLTVSLMQGASALESPFSRKSPIPVLVSKNSELGPSLYHPYLTFIPKVASVLSRGGPHYRTPISLGGFLLLQSSDDPEKGVSAILYAHLGHCDKVSTQLKGWIPSPERTTPLLPSETVLQYRMGWP